MLGSTDLNAEIADCWKLVWKVEPAARILPLAVEALALVLGAAAAEELALLAEVLGAAADELDDDDEDDEHAARASAATTALLTVATCFLPRNCISGLSL
jgi:hypothetical protein